MPNFRGRQGHHLVLANQTKPRKKERKKERIIKIKKLKNSPLTIIAQGGSPHKGCLKHAITFASHFYFYFTKNIYLYDCMKSFGSIDQLQIVSEWCIGI
jgi:hypothetical protein